MFELAMDEAPAGTTRPLVSAGAAAVAKRKPRKTAIRIRRCIFNIREGFGFCGEVSASRFPTGTNLSSSSVPGLLKGESHFPSDSVSIKIAQWKIRIFHKELIVQTRVPMLV